MAGFNVPENVSVEDFFKNHVPKQFKEMTAGVDLSALSGKAFTLQFDVAGKKYCLNIQGGADVQVLEGGVDKPVLALQMSESDWRDAVTGKLAGVIDRFIDPGQVADKQRYGTLLATNGTMTVELKKPDGSTMPIAMAFNGAGQPAVTIKLSLEDWVAMQNKQVDGQTLVMSGKMQFEGDMMFLMSLQQLI